MFLIVKLQLSYLILLQFSYPSDETSDETFVLGAKKNRLIETVLLSTNNICFG